MNLFVAPDLGAQWADLLPYVIVAGGGLLVLLVDAFVKTLKKDHLSYLTLLVLIGSIVVQIVSQGSDTVLLNGMMVANGFTRFFNFLFGGIGVMTSIRTPFGSRVMKWRCPKGSSLSSRRIGRPCSRARANSASTSSTSKLIRSPDTRPRPGSGLGVQSERLRCWLQAGRPVPLQRRAILSGAIRFRYFRRRRDRCSRP